MTSNLEPEDGALRRDLPFLYRLHRPARADGEALVLLHGSGPDETSMMPLGRQIAPEATLVSVRGRIIQDGDIRWFSKITPTRFEQDSIRAEADAFAGFVTEVAKLHGLDPARTAFVGYSNGANLVSSTMLLHPGLIGRAALLRAMPVLDEEPTADLSGARVVVVAGAADVTYAPFAPALVGLLRRHGAEVEARTVASGHEFGAADADLVREWLRRPAEEAGIAAGGS
jgi:phospholipase/carboxylesterase